ncbi:MAG: energy transducer TonB [Gammaproteobacteria bacterium]|jgi:TonB family protein
MRRCILTHLVIAACSTTTVPALAEWRCDCTTILDSCTAEVAVQDTFVEVSTQSAQCARVDYFIDGIPFVSVAVDGSAREDWITRSDDPRILVRSCQVCADNANAPTADSDSPDEAEEPASELLMPLVAPEPIYPRQAQERGLEGSVTVEFTINPYGDTQDVRVAAAQPAGVFDLAAVSAVSRWRYAADGNREPVSRRETLEFTIEDFIFADTATPAASPAADSAAARPGNRCVRENITYNYSEMIEVGLISVCAQPITVYACATGVGAMAQRWVCSSTDENQTVLVRPGDSRVGFTVSLPTQTGTGQFEYADHFFVARAPNTEYWWIACGSDDERCRVGGRQWTESLDRQAAHIDPQLRTRLDVARSY